MAKATRWAVEMAARKEWVVLYDEDFGRWFRDQEVGVQKEILVGVAVLRNRGPQLGRPYVDSINDSAIPNMKEMRLQYKGEPWRILVAFDPNRAAILLVGGCKTGKGNRWHSTHIPIADARIRRHIENLKKDK